ncbi:hypothetical protein AU255_17540 [Methyloprofundus sedimenti]|uniref:Uncharacterized protein n=1 Tax=Methyloprofundus sedimenti TaxID=1420851 RepID=A0A1V8M131_9GAMM|nr:hypothetical protein [Methyloprofundus sedimenti]OQK15280.1 hypothetical protein AU255_17540 [Methyloprofundus sedimenti]
MKKKTLIFIACLVGILAFQYKAVIPFAEKVASSSLFLEETGDEGSRLPSSTPMTTYAFNQCNIAIRDEVDSDINIIFPAEPLKSWSLGNYQYIINAEIELSSETGPAFFRKYACQIKYDDGKDPEGILDSDNWTLYGLSGISDL